MVSWARTLGKGSTGPVLHLSPSWWLHAGSEAVEESSDEADDPPNAVVDPAIRSEAVSKRKVIVLARKKFAALPFTATAQEDEPDGTEGAGAGQGAAEDSGAVRVIGSKKGAPEKVTAHLAFGNPASHAAASHHTLARVASA